MTYTFLKLVAALGLMLAMIHESAATIDFSTESNAHPTQLGSISGTVTEDTTKDQSGDAAINGATITLFDSSGNFVANMVTDTGFGGYSFPDVPSGSYTIVETNLDGYDDVSDTDGQNDNMIQLFLGVGQSSDGNNFVDKKKPLGSISGTVRKVAGLHDLDDGVVGGISGLVINLHEDFKEDTVATTLTDIDGGYSFPNLEPGNYYMKAGTSYFDEVEGKVAIDVVLKDGEHSTNNNFVDVKNSISGTVTEDTGGPLSGVQLELYERRRRSAIATTYTDTNGKYSFLNVVAETSYLIREINPDGYFDVSDNGIIWEPVGAFENLSGIDFVDRRGGSISGRVMEVAGGLRAGGLQYSSGVQVSLFSVDAASAASADSAASSEESSGAVSFVDSDTTTDAKGAYKFSGLDVSADGAETTRYLVVYSSYGSTSQSPEQRFTANGEVEYISIGLGGSSAPFDSTGNDIYIKKRVV